MWQVGAIIPRKGSASPRIVGPLQEDPSTTLTFPKTFWKKGTNNNDSTGKFQCDLVRSSTTWGFVDSVVLRCPSLPLSPLPSPPLPIMEPQRIMSCLLRIAPYIISDILKWQLYCFWDRSSTDLFVRSVLPCSNARTMTHSDLPHVNTSTAWWKIWINTSLPGTTNLHANSLLRLSQLLIHLQLERTYVIMFVNTFQSSYVFWWSYLRRWNGKIM